MLKRTLLASLFAMAVVVGCGDNLQFLGSLTIGAGASRSCSDLRASADEDKLNEARTELRRKAGYSSEPCDQSGAVGRCTIEIEEEEGSVNTQTYYYEDAAGNQRKCEQDNGSWDSL